MSSDRTRVVVLGGGIAGLEALLAISDLAEDRVAATLVSPTPEFLYKPLLVEEPFDLGPAERHELAPLAGELGADFVVAAAERVRPGDHAVDLAGAPELAYDKLIVAVGARFQPAFSSAVTFPGPEPLAIDKIIERAAAEFHGRVAFVVPPGV